MEAHYTTPLGPFARDIGAAFASFTSRQDVSALPLPILPANAVDKGTMIKIEAEGEFSTTATPTLVLGLYAGAVGASGGGTLTSILAESSAITTGSGAAAWPWRMEYRGKITLTGSSGTIVGCGDLELGTSLTASTTVPIPITLALRTVTLNTSIANAIGVCATFGASSASNIVKTYAITASLLN
jgi:hypothetical protein